MSTAEVIAYMAGAQAKDDLDAGVDAPLTPDEAKALLKLGPVEFAYWMLRGATEKAEG